MLKTFNKEGLILGITFLLSLVASLVLEAWVRRCGFILTPDSNNYLSAAKSFRETGLFIGTGGTYYTQWPPLFPFILSWFSDPVQTMEFVFMLCKIVTGLFVVVLANSFLKKLLFKAVFLVGTMLGVHFLLISVFLWSEMIFITLCITHLYLVLNLHRKPIYYWLVIILGFLLCLQRNAGVFLIVSAAVWMLTAGTAPLINKAQKSIFYVVASTSGLVAWNVYNFFLLKNITPFYDRDFFADTLINIHGISSSLGHSFFPLQGNAAAVAGVILIIMLSVGWYTYLRYDAAFSLLALSIVVYTLGFIPVGHVDREMDRFLAVTFPIVLLLALAITERITILKPRSRLVVVICVFMGLGYNLSRTANNAMLWHEMSCGRVSNK